MYLNNNLGDIMVANYSKNEDTNKPALNKLKNKRTTASDLQLSFEVFRNKLYDSERNVKDNIAVEDHMNMGSSIQSSKQLQNNEDHIKKVSNDIKLIWLQSTLNFIKNDHQITLIFPTISIEETDFIEAILNQGYEPDLDGRFSSLYLSLREALTIYKTKYIFALNTLFRSETTIKLELEKIPKNNKLKFAKMQSMNNEVKSNTINLKKRIKIVNDKMSILNAVPMHYIIDCYKQILDFLYDDFRFTITFDKLKKKEYDFMMNVKQIVKSREILEDGLPEELNSLLQCISTHKDYAFSLIPNRAKFEEKYVIIMKVPKGGVRGNFQSMEDSINISQTCYNYTVSEDIETNNKVLYRKIDNTIKNTIESTASNVESDQKQIRKELNNNIFKSNNLCPIQTKSDFMLRRANSLSSCFMDYNTSPLLEEMSCNSWENINISHWQQSSAADCLSVYNKKKKLPNQPQPIQFQRGSVDMLDEHSRDVKKQNNVRRSWSTDRHDRHVNQMKTKMYEALQVPLKSTKAVRMMQLMGWKGGALGSRGEGITEPIMPAIGIQPGAGLGHGSNNSNTNAIRKVTPPVPLIQPEKKPENEKSSKKSKKCNRNYTVIEGEETRLKILTKILEFIKSGESKMVICFDEILQEEDTRFVICSIDRFNRRKYVRNLKSQYGADDLRKVQEAMLAKPHVNLAAQISEDKKDIVLTKTFKGENNNEMSMDFAIDTTDSIRLNISVFRYIKTMKPKEFYGVFTKPSYQLLGFKLSMLEQILKFMDIKQSTLMLYVDINLQDRHTDFLQNFIDVINMGRKPRYATEIEEVLVEKIYNKVGDYCFILDYFRPLKIIKLQKRNRNTQDFNTCESKNNEKDTNELKQDEVIEDLKDKQNKDNLNQINSLEYKLEKTVEKITTNIMNSLTQMYGKGVNNAVSDTSVIQENTQTEEQKEVVPSNSFSATNTSEIFKEEQNTDIFTIDLTEDEHIKEEQVQNNSIQDFKHEEENLEDNVEENTEAIQEEDRDLSAESEDILEIIDDLEQSIKLEENANIEEVNHKRNRSDSNDSQSQDTKKVKLHSIKCYKQIQIIPNNRIETMNNNLAGIVQSLISNAIDSCVCLPLLQCNGIIDDKLLYICYNENTYIWLKTVLNDQFEVLENNLSFEGRRKLKINLKTYIYDDTSKILHRIKLYNSYLDVDNWKIDKTFVSLDSTYLWVEMDEEDYHFISRNDFSLFAGIDKATFSVMWD